MNQTTNQLIEKMIADGVYSVVIIKAVTNDYFH